MGLFRKEIGTPPAILVDGFNFIALFAQHHEWRWHLRWQGRRQPVWQLWEVSRSGVAFQICRDDVWQLNMAEPEVYCDVRECMERTAAHRVGAFRPQQHRVSPAWAIQETSVLATRLGREAGVAPEAVIVNGNDVYASFRPATAATGITVIEATYGGNCRAPSGHATRLLRAQCEGQRACTFRVDSREIGDPAPGCAKDFVATWACSGEQGVRVATVQPEAGFGAVAILSCGPES